MDMDEPQHDFQAKTSKDLKQLLQILDGPKDLNQVHILKLSLSDDSVLNYDFNYFLWSILSHPRAEIDELHITEEECENVVGDLGVMTIVKRWCEEIPAKGSRKISLSMHFDSTETVQEVLVELRQALTSTGNGVTELTLEGIPKGGCIVGSLLSHVLGNPSNELTGLCLTERNDLGEDDAVEISKAFALPHCKLRHIEMNLNAMPFAAAQSILEGLNTVDNLEQLSLPVWEFWFKEGETERLMRKLAQLIKRPGNHLRAVKWDLNCLDERQISIFVHALANKHCRLVELDCGSALTKQNGALPLFGVLQHQYTQLKILRGNFCGEASYSVLARHLQDANCQLETLAVGGNLDYGDGVDRGVVTAIAVALKSASCSRLKTLHMGRQPPDVFSVFAESLRSGNNKLTELILDGGDSIDKATLCDFFRAIRISNIVYFEDGFLRYLEDSPRRSFRKAFNSPFFQVLHTLLSVAHLPRLGHSCCFSLLPVKDFILTIAETLGWPLDDLRL